MITIGTELFILTPGEYKFCETIKLMVNETNSYAIDIPDMDPGMFRYFHKYIHELSQRPAFNVNSPGMFDWEIDILHACGSRDGRFDLKYPIINHLNRPPGVLSPIDHINSNYNKFIIMAEYFGCEYASNAGKKHIAKLMQGKTPEWLNKYFMAN